MVCEIGLCCVNEIIILKFLKQRKNYDIIHISDKIKWSEGLLS